MAERGQDYILEISTDGGTTYEKVGYMRSKSFSRSKALIDTSSDEDPDNATSIAGQKSATLSGEAIYVYDDTGQDTIETAFDATDAADARLTNNVTGARQFSGKVHITSLELAGETNGVVTYSIDAEFTGAVTKSDVA